MRILLLFLFISFCATTNASDYEEIELDRICLNNQGSNISYLSLYSFDNSKSNYLDLVTLPSLPDSSINIEYRGIQEIIVRQIRRRITSRGRGIIRDRYEESFMNYIDFMHEMQDYHDMINDAKYGKWWDRELWFDSLPPNKGGAPHQTTFYIGSNHDLINIGPFAISNTGRLRIRNLTSIDLDSREFSVLEELQTLEKDDYDETPNSNAPQRIIGLHLSPNPWPHPSRHIDSMWKNSVWKIGIEPEVRLRFSMRDLTFNGDFSIKILTKIYSRGNHVVNLEFLGKYKPFTNEAIGSFAFSILSF